MSKKRHQRLPKEGELIPYPKAFKLLKDKLNASPEEIAAWVFFGPAAGGLSAFLNTHELATPLRFSYESVVGEESDYVGPLMECWFVEDEVRKFQPTDRYLTGAKLLERWSELPGILPKAYIRLQIRESRLVDYHPIYGGTDASNPNDDTFPPLEAALFLISEIEDIETADFDLIGIETIIDGSRTDQKQSQQITAILGDECTQFRAMEGLSADELTIAFIGDKTDFGIGGNGMLEISARQETKRVPLAALGLVDRRKGVLNSQGAILLGMAQKKKLLISLSNSAKISRLRKVFTRCLGISNPFEPYRPIEGWQPLFKVFDKRGAADERAKQHAEHRTESLEDLGERDLANKQLHSNPYDDADAGQKWLDDNDPEA